MCQLIRRTSALTYYFLLCQFRAVNEKPLKSYVWITSLSLGVLEIFHLPRRAKERAVFGCGRLGSMVAKLPFWALWKSFPVLIRKLCLESFPTGLPTVQMLAFTVWHTLAKLHNYKVTKLYVIYIYIYILVQQVNNSLWKPITLQQYDNRSCSGGGVRSQWEISHVPNHFWAPGTV